MQVLIFLSLVRFFPLKKRNHKWELLISHSLYLSSCCLTCFVHHQLESLVCGYGSNPSLDKVCTTQRCSRCRDVVQNIPSRNLWKVDFEHWDYLGKPVKTTGLFQFCRTILSINECCPGTTPFWSAVSVSKKLNNRHSDDLNILSIMSYVQAAKCS